MKLYKLHEFVCPEQATVTKGLRPKQVVRQSLQGCPEIERKRDMKAHFLPVEDLVGHHPLQRFAENIFGRKGPVLVCAHLHILRQSGCKLDKIVV